MVLYGDLIQLLQNDGGAPQKRLLTFQQYLLSVQRSLHMMLMR